MPSGSPEPEVHVFGFFLVPNFALLPFASAIEALRAANRLAERRLYDWVVISRDGRPVVSSSGIEGSANAGIDRADHLRDLIVVAGIGGHEYRDKQVFAWLRGLARAGCRLGAMSLGTYVLARCGLLDGHRCTLHWENLDSFAEEFPRIEATPELLEIDRSRYTCAGGTAALDLMLTLIAREHGRTLATRVADSLMHERIRDGDDPQRMTLRTRLGIAHPRLLDAVALMEANHETPLTRADLAARVGFSPRQLERLFRRYIGSTPTRYYLELRLERARRILLQTSMPILEVALACGFVSASHFTKSYRDQYGRTPSQERRSGDPARSTGVRQRNGTDQGDGPPAT